MSDDLTNQTRLNLAVARDEYRQALAQAELLEIEVIEMRSKANTAAERTRRLQNVLAILDDTFVPEQPASTNTGVPQAKPVEVAAPADPGLSVAEQVAKAAAAGDELASRSASGGGHEDRSAPPPSNRPAPGPACPGCGTLGSMAQSQIYVGDRGPFPAIVCGHCGHQKAMI